MLARVTWMLLEEVAGAASLHLLPSRVVALVLLDQDDTFATILGTANLLDHRQGHLWLLDLLRLRAFQPVQALTLVLLASRPSGDTVAQVAVVVVASILLLASCGWFFGFFCGCHRETRCTRRNRN